VSPPLILWKKGHALLRGVSLFRSPVVMRLARVVAQ